MWVDAAEEANKKVESYEIDSSMRVDVYKSVRAFKERMDNGEVCIRFSHASTPFLRKRALRMCLYVFGTSHKAKE